MISLFLFIGITVLLSLEGALIARAILSSNDRWMLASLGLPIAAFVNVLIVFLWTVFSIPLTPVSLLLPQILIVAGLSMKKDIRHKIEDVNSASFLPSSIFRLPSWPKSFLQTLCIVLLSITFIFSFAHAVLLPTFQYDSATNWTMRSQISFYDHAIAFDPTEIRGMAKPQYPFLFHALQITMNQGQGEWNDTAANAILWLLSISTFAAIFLILKKLTGTLTSLVTLTLISGIPLLSVHLSQGYADITLTQELLLSMTCLFAWIRLKERKWLILSTLLVASSVWTKSEGLFFGLIPWLITVGAILMMDRSMRKKSLTPIILAIALSVPWHIFALVKGLLLTPHAGDTAFTFQSKGVREAFTGLFDRGSFGIAWYVIVAALLIIIVEIIRNRKLMRSPELAVIGWGIIVFLENLFIYLFTPNVQFLLNAESYYRQMMVATALLILACAVWFGREKETKEPKE